MIITLQEGCTNRSLKVEGKEFKDYSFLEQKNILIKVLMAMPNERYSVALEALLAEHSPQSTKCEQ